MPPRETLVDWGFWVYVEMLVVGIAAGAYLTAALLEWAGRGRSRAARAAHVIAFPLMILATVLLIIDLNRPERFWHMALMSERLLPIIKTWSPISFGTWLIIAFSAVTFVSFVDALFDRTRFSIGWRPRGTLHGTPAGLVWSAIGGVLAIGVGMYSGLLIGTTNIPGWSDSVLLAAVYIVTAGLTGAATLILVDQLGPGARTTEDRTTLVQLQEFMSMLAILWLAVVAVAFLTMGDARSAIVHGVYALALVVAIVLAGIAPLVIRFLWRPDWRSAPVLLAALVLVGAFLLRFAIVMGPQEV